MRANCRLLAIVTGASSGIGFELAKLFAQIELAMSGVVSQDTLAEQNRKISEPGSARK